jgi:hypothetical protein
MAWHAGDSPSSSEREVGTSRSVGGVRASPSVCATPDAPAPFAREMRSYAACAGQPTNQTSTRSPSRTGNRGNVFSLDSVMKYARTAPPVSPSTGATSSSKAASATASSVSAPSCNTVTSTNPGPSPPATSRCLVSSNLNAEPGRAGRSSRTSSESTIAPFAVSRLACQIGPR